MELVEEFTEFLQWKAKKDTDSLQLPGAGTERSGTSEVSGNSGTAGEGSGTGEASVLV